MQSALADLGAGGPVSRCGFDFLIRSDLYHTQRPYYFSGALEGDQEQLRTNLKYETHDQIEVRDIRGHVKDLALEKHGFELLKHQAAADLGNPSDEDMKMYLEDLASKVKDHLDAELVLAYSFRFRREKTEDDSVKSGALPGTHGNQDKPVLVPHTDQSREGGLRRARRHLSDEEAGKYLDGNWRVRILNAWRPLNDFTDERPLAMCDFHTVQDEDLLSADRVSREYVGEIYYMHYNPSQQWYWISGQKPDEMLLFTNFDSNPGNGVPFMVHSSFVNERAKTQGKRRESLETALIVISGK